MKWFWGLLILVIGLIILGQNFNVWGFDNFDQLSKFWPLILILFGITLMVRHIRFNWLIILISFIAAIALIYFVSLNASDFKVNKDNQTYDFSQNLPSEVKKAKIIINTGAVELNIKDNGNQLINGNLVSNYNQPDISTTISGDTATVILKSTKINNSVWGKNILNIEITDKIPIDLIINAGAASMNLDFSKISLSNLDVNSGASSMNITLGEVINGSNISIETGASSVTIKTPKELGVKIIAKTGLTGKNFEGYNKIDNQTYLSPNFDQTNTKITLTISAGASSINVEPSN